MKIPRRGMFTRSARRSATIAIVSVLLVAVIGVAVAVGPIGGIIAGLFAEKEPVIEAIGKIGTGEVAVNGSAGYEIDVVDKKVEENKGKFAAVTIPAKALAPDAKNVKVTFIETNLPKGITVAEDCDSVTYDIAIEGLAKDNKTPVKVYIYIGEEYNAESIAAVYHNSTAVTGYFVSNGYVVFDAASFSPYTVVFKETPVVNEPEVDEPGEEEPGLDIPTAEVTYQEQYVNVDIDWENYGGWSPTEGLDSKLEAAFQFVSPHTSATVNTCEYKDWYCDFYVKLDRDLGPNQIFLGGNYGDFGWVGFHNGELELPANEEIGLLESVTSNPWTYADIASFVGTFICGVGDVNNALDGATFTVSLRLTNPEDATEYYNVNVVTYTFGGNYTITDINSNN